MLSVIIPFHNESRNLDALLPELLASMKGFVHPFEVVLVDDGSTDRHYTVNVEGPVRLLRHGRRMGKGRALRTGVREAKGDIMCFMDADCQDDPKDIARLYEKLESGYDLVNGVREKRRDGMLVKLYSHIAHIVLKNHLQSPFADINCGFKMFRRKVLETVPLYGNSFRFFPLAVYYEGYRVSEIAVHNRVRLHGQSKFGSGKLFIGMLDMLSAYFLYRFADRPLHFFGPIGACSFFVGALILAYITYERIFFAVLLYRRPALQYAIFLVILGVQIVMTGIIAELIVYLHSRSATGEQS